MVRRADDGTVAPVSKPVGPITNGRQMIAIVFPSCGGGSGMAHWYGAERIFVVLHRARV